MPTGFQVSGDPERSPPASTLVPGRPLHEPQHLVSAEALGPVPSVQVGSEEGQEAMAGPGPLRLHHLAESLEPR